MASTEAQKRANKAYKEKHKGEYKVFQTGFKVEEAEHLESVLTAHNLTKADLIRRAVARLERGEEL